MANRQAQLELLAPSMAPSAHGDYGMGMLGEFHTLTKSTKIVSVTLSHKTSTNGKP